MNADVQVTVAEQLYASCLAFGSILKLNNPGPASIELAISNQRRVFCARGVSKDRYAAACAV